MNEMSASTPIELVCPKCGGAMRQYERNGITVDQCSECRGIFLDRGELERLMEAEDVHYGIGQSRSDDRLGAPQIPPVSQSGYSQPGYNAGYPPPGYDQHNGGDGNHGRGGKHGGGSHSGGDPRYGSKKRRGGFLGELLDF